MIQCGILYLNYPLFQEYPYKFLFRYVFFCFMVIFYRFASKYIVEKQSAVNYGTHSN